MAAAKRHGRLLDLCHCLIAALLQATKLGRHLRGWHGCQAAAESTLHRTGHLRGTFMTTSLRSALAREPNGDPFGGLE